MSILAKVIVESILEDLRGRQGVGDALDAIDSTIMEEEVKPELTTIVDDLIAREAGQ